MCLRRKTNSNAIVCNDSLSHFFRVIQQTEKEVPACSREVKQYLTSLNQLTLRLLMSYIYMEHLFLMFLDHTYRRSTVGRTPLDE